MTDVTPETLSAISPRLEAAQNIWLASVRPDSSPHLIPIWFVWHDNKLWISTGDGSRKHKNIQQNPRVSVSLEDASHPLVIEGTAREETAAATRDALAPHFHTKYEWDFRTDSDYGMLISITPTKILLGA
jgi:PPOX class probable F420-dependent enzyme